MSKSGDQIVLERRLKPIYDAIDTGNYKKAIQEADKVLRKHPATHCAKALKALAYIRCDRVMDAWTLIDEVDGEKDDNDENTLQALCHCFKEAYTPGRIVQMYEKICARQPKNEQHMTHLFMSYVRVRNYKLQQKTALALYKEFPRNPYYFWNVMSIVMQAISGDQELARTMLYPLAEKMVKKMIDSNSIQAEAECDLYAMILEQAGKSEESAHFLEGQLDILMSRKGPMAPGFTQQPTHFLLYRVLKLHQKAGNHMLVVERCINALRNEPDDWTLWSYLFDNAFQQMKLEFCTEPDRKSLIDRVVERVVSLVELCNAMQDKDRPRGPYLARLTLISKLLENDLILPNQLGTLQIGEPMDHLLEYVRLFHGKPCCFVDIRPFMWLINDENVVLYLDKVSEFVEGLRKSQLPFNNSKIPESLKWADIVYERLKRVLGKHSELSQYDRRELCYEMIRRVELCEDSTLAAAAYGQIAAHLQWDLWSESSNVNALYQLILFLEWIRQRHPSDPLCRLVLAKCYAILGITAEVQKVMQSLDIKYVQRDTLGYYMFGLLEQYGRFNASVVYYTELSILYDQTEKEISECLTTAYKNGNFSQIPRLVKFLDTITKSSMAIGADVESRALSACFAVDKVEHVIETLNGDDDHIDFKSIADDRDLNVIPSLDAADPGKKIEEVKERTHLELVDRLQLRYYLCKCIAAIGRANTTHKMLLSQLAQLRKHAEYCQNEYCSADALPELLQSPPSMHSDEYLRGSSLKLLFTLIDAAVTLMKYSEEAECFEIPNNCAREEKMLECMPDVQAVSDCARGVATYGEPVKGNFSLHPQLRHCASALETFAFALIIIRLLETLIDRLLGGYRLQKGRKGGAQKSAKKHSSLARLTMLRSTINEFVKVIDAQLSEDLHALKSDELMPDIPEDIDDDILEILTAQKSVTDPHILSSYTSSINDMREAVQRMLSSPWS
ncbi:hypothetical protein AB6A40_006219 [Gnathostoma spinigerum]|uniref:N-terminal acetyltransferase B complex subunit MDM20 homolog n=1 Tax=Gnathostoma spinigerum TaxID=75299 RepID=A0ABD6EIW7_9BILA